SFEELTMISSSRIRRLAVLALPMTTLATLLSVLAPRPATALDPCPPANTRVVNFGNLSLNGCTISGVNTPGVNGGGIENHGTLVISNSTISGNVAGLAGGGIYNGPSGTMTLTNVVVSGNTASGGDGGGIDNDGGTISMTNVTVTGNTASSG